VLRAAAGRARPLVALAYAAAVRALARFLRAGVPGASVYACGSLGRDDVVLGLSDVDLAVVVPDAGAVLAAAERRRARVGRLPLVRDVVDVAVYVSADLDRVGGRSILTFDGAAYGGAVRGDAVVRLERPRLEAPLAGCRLLAGPDRRPAGGRARGDERRLAAWLELQFWWTSAFRACVDPAVPDTPLLCAKIVAEPARIWLWLEHDERPRTRREALERAAEALPAESDALRAAVSLLDRVGADPEPPVAASVSTLARLSERIAGLVERDVADAAETAVRLAGDVGDVEGAPPGAVPLADWRARVFAPQADELLVVRPGDPSDAGAVAAAAGSEQPPVVPALASGRLLVLPTAGGRLGRARLRAVQCAASDPVSFALLAGRDRAAFPDVAGWSAVDCARRALAEHGARGAGRVGEATLEHLLNALRAAVFAGSLADGEPVLPLTVAAAVAEGRVRGAAPDALLDEAEGAFRRLRREGVEAPPAVVAALEDALRRHPAYAGG
jgi:predicted nucleotidyltransferase